MTLTEFNTLSKEQAFQHLEKCCVSKTWIHKMIAAMPFESEDILIKKAATVWYNECEIIDYKEAFTGHPKIGDVSSLQKKFAKTSEWAAHEQGKVKEANKKVIEDLAKANDIYLNKFGYIFIVSASGKSAEEMLTIVQERLNHSIKDEIYVAMNEQHKITVIRLVKLIESISEKADLRSHLTTHALDTSIGIPANKMVVSLQDFKDNKWETISVGITNNDGRITDVIAPGKYLSPGIYNIIFKTGDYYTKNNQKGFYPEVAIQFTVTDENHYHVPLLINPFGYSTYKGS